MNLTDWENLIKSTRANFIKNAPHYIDLAVKKNIKTINDTSNFIKKVYADAYHEFFFKRRTYIFKKYFEKII